MVKTSRGFEDRVPSYQHCFLPLLASRRITRQDHGGMKFAEVADG